jgi:hypothetical protein
MSYNGEGRVADSMFNSMADRAVRSISNLVDRVEYSKYKDALDRVADSVSKI